MAIENIFFIESPLQLKSYLNIRENLDNFDEHACLIFIRLNENQANIEQIRNLCEKNKIGAKIISFNSSKGKKIEIALKALLLICKNFMSIFKANRVYVGDYRSQWMNFLSKFNLARNVYFLDDGMATIGFYNKLKKESESKKIKVKLITSFSLESTKYCEVFGLKRTKITKPKNNRVSYILGMPLVELSIISEAEYLSFIKRCIDESKIKNVADIYYIPHRNEDSVNFHKILGLHNLSPLIIDVPIEEYLTLIGEIPDNYFSLYSTSIVNIDMMFDDVNIYSYRIDTELVTEKFKEPIVSAYEYIETSTSIKFLN